MKKQISILFLLLCVQISALAVIPGGIVKGTAKLSGKNIPMWFTITDNGQAVVGNGNIASISQYSEGHLEVPATIKTADNQQYTVVGIGNFAFSLCSNLTSITIPEGVKSVGEQAFTGCGSLTTVNLPSSLTSIARGAFCECRQLSNIQLPEALREIGQEAFVSVKFPGQKVVIPRQISTIPVGAFEKCSLSVVILPPGLKTVEADAFMDINNCDFYMFDGNTAPQVAEGAFNCSGNWFVTAPKKYTVASFCKGKLPISSMTHDGNFNDGNLTFSVSGYGTYPGIFEAAATKRNSTTPWEHTFSAIPTSVVHPSFTGNWKPTYTVTGITPQFFSGEGIEQLHHVSLPASIVPAQAAKAFAKSLNLLSLDLTKLAPLTDEVNENLLAGLPENTIVYAPLMQTETTRAHNMVITEANGQRHTNLFKLEIGNQFDELSIKGNLAYTLPYGFRADKAVFSRSSFALQKKETIVLPFTAQPQGKAYTFKELRTADNTTTAVFSEATEMTAHKPYLYISNGNAIEAANVDITAPELSVDVTAEANMVGTNLSGIIRELPGMQLFNGQIYVYANSASTTAGTLMLAGNKAKITPFHAFFYTKTPIAGSKIDLLIDNETTGIESFGSAINSEDAPVYNIQGIRIPTSATSSKGLYIRQGKKYINK